MIYLAIIYKSCVYTPKGTMKVDANLYVSIGVKLTVALIGLLIMTRLLGKRDLPINRL